MSIVDYIFFISHPANYIVYAPYYLKQIIKSTNVQM